MRAAPLPCAAATCRSYDGTPCGGWQRGRHGPHRAGPRVGRRGRGRWARASIRPSARATGWPSTWRSAAASAGGAARLPDAVPAMEVRRLRRRWRRRGATMVVPAGQLPAHPGRDELRCRRALIDRHDRAPSTSTQKRAGRVAAWTTVAVFGIGPHGRCGASWWPRHAAPASSRVDVLRIPASTIARGLGADATVNSKDQDAGGGDPLQLDRGRGRRTWRSTAPGAPAAQNAALDIAARALGAVAFVGESRSDRRSTPATRSSARC